MVKGRLASVETVVVESGDEDSPPLSRWGKSGDRRTLVDCRKSVTAASRAGP